MGANVNVTTHYPYSEKYVYETTMEILNLDEERVKDITTGNGFIISAPKAIKDDLKDDNGIFSTKYGQTLQDRSPYGNRYRCKCGYMMKRCVLLLQKILRKLLPRVKKLLMRNGRIVP